MKKHSTITAQEFERRFNEGEMGLEWVPSGERVASTVVVLWRTNAAKSAGCVFIARKSIVWTWRNGHTMIFPEMKHDSPNGSPRHASCLGSFLARHESRHG
jgi:hypothetical protein